MFRSDLFILHKLIIQTMSNAILPHMYNSQVSDKIVIFHVLNIMLTKHAIFSLAAYWKFMGGAVCNYELKIIFIWVVIYCIAC